MKVKITNCTQERSWYRNRIGDEFDVLETSKDIDGEKIFIVEKGRILNSYVSEKDCIIIEDCKNHYTDDYGKCHICREQVWNKNYDNKTN